MRRRFLSTFVCIFTIVGALLVAAPSQAQEWRPIHDRSQAGADIYLWSAEFTATTLPLVGFFNIGLTPDLYLDIQAPFVTNFDDTVSAGIGNPTFGMHWADQVSRPVTLHLGGGVSAPVASIDDANWRYANALGSLAMAFHDSYLWLVEYVPAHGDFGIEWHPIDEIYFRADLEPIVAIPFDSGGRRRTLITSNNDDVEVILQNTIEFEARADVGIGGGIALLPVWVPTETGDNFQVSAEPFLSYDNGVFFMRIGGLTALDRPLGLGFDRGRVASLHARFGGQW